MTTEFETFVTEKLNLKSKKLKIADIGGKKLKDSLGRYTTNLVYPIELQIKEDGTGNGFNNSVGFYSMVFEADDISISDQLKLLSYFKENNMEPTFATYSGYNPDNIKGIRTGKSIHMQWVLKAILPKNQLKKYISVQKALIEKFNGDKKIVSSLRLTRLPGYKDEFINQQEITTSRKLYEFKQIEEFVKDFIKVESEEEPKIKIEWNNTLDDEYLTDRNTKISVKQFIESGKKNQSLICTNPEHMEKNHSAYMILNKKNVTVGCHGCDFKKVYKLTPAKKEYEMFDIVEINEKYIPVELLHKYDNIILKSGTGTGKTMSMANSGYCQKFISIIISHLVNLSKNEASVLNTKFYQDKKGFIDIEKFKSVSICINSISRVIGNPEFVFVDEIMQVLSSIVSGTVEEKENITVRLQEMIIESKKTILADAHCDLDVLNDFLKPTGKKFTVIINSYKSNRERTLYLKEINFYKAIDEKIGEKNFYYCASKAQADYLESYLQDKHNEISFNINRDTVAKYSEHFKDPNKMFDIVRNVIASPSMGSGVSIDRKDINVFCHAESGEHVSAKSLWQGMERVRTPLTTNIYIGSRNINLPEDPVEIYNNELNAQNNNDKYCMAIVNRKRDFANRELIELFSTIAATDNYYKNNIKDEFYKMLFNDGKVKKSAIQSSAVETNEFKKDKIADVKKVRQARSKEILDAQAITKEEYYDLTKNINDGLYVDRSDMNSVKKFRYERYFDLNEDLIFNLEYNGLLKKIYRFSNLACFGNESFKAKMVKSDFDSDKESKWGNSKDPLYYSTLEQFINETESHLGVYISSIIETKCALPLNPLILNTKLTPNLISKISILSGCDTDDVNKFIGSIYNSIGIKTKRIQGKNKGYSIDINSVKEMVELSRKVIEKNMSDTTIDVCLKEIFKKYSEES
jgi:RNase P subunit RPR2